MCYYVGIDVAKFKHDFTIVTSDGEVILQSTTFKNDFKGFETIKDSLANLDHSQEIKIGNTFFHRLRIFFAKFIIPVL